MSERLLSDGAVLLRPWTEADVPAIVECLDGDEEIARWLDLVPQPYRAEHALEWLRGGGPRGEKEITWAVTADGRILGAIGTTPQGDDVYEVGYWIRADARGQGFMSRALRLVADWVVREQGGQRVYLRADPENVASCRVAEKAGFTREGVLRSAHWNDRQQRRQSWTVYSLLPTDAR